ncbi:hypothetical protein JCM19294_197 [Nonlabens tegetincola]|uniref:Uncharacterized protein n=1 Tax=Nonlabens tegetincola TaxID=323273 RepID=A0A090QQ96_9FLAO|nr:MULTISPECIES: porin family protein [Nonlabens]ALM21961.1 hypothetical protein AAT17_12315 [Nonlabens sp. MIC269]PQJ17180.1 hypothetical protein BST93_11020 [Nonlabens tegetincola]GAK97661.1 hypothetical protein JCM19294_197 [Nonlabens tegetincola]
MKKLLVSFAVFFCVSIIATAQEFSYGLLGGVNISKINNVGGGELEDNAVSFHAGLNGLFTFDDRWSAETSILYSREGETFEIGNTESEINLDFINIPLHVRYRVWNNLTVHAGPQVGFLLNATQSVAGGNEVDIDDEVTVDSNLSVSLGLGYDFPELGLFLKANFAEGVTDLFDNEEFKNDEYTRLVRFSVGYRF